MGYIDAILTLRVRGVEDLKVGRINYEIRDGMEKQWLPCGNNWDCHGHDCTECKDCYIGLVMEEEVSI